MGSEQNISITIAQLYVKLRILTYIIAQNNNKLLCVLVAPPCPRPSLHACSSLVLRLPELLLGAVPTRSCSRAPILQALSYLKAETLLRSCIIPPSLHSLVFRVVLTSRGVVSAYPLLSLLPHGCLKFLTKLPKRYFLQFLKYLSRKLLSSRS